MGILYDAHSRDGDTVATLGGPYIFFIHLLWPPDLVMGGHYVFANVYSFVKMSFYNNVQSGQSRSDIYKNLAIAKRSRVSCAHNSSRASIGLITLEI